MKRILSLLLVCITLLSLVNCAGTPESPTSTHEAPAPETTPETASPGNSAHSYDPNSKGKKILFLGGSITCGGGASAYDNGWACLAFDGIGKELYGEDVQMINSSISGTGSLVAAYRLEEHVLKFCPDLVFVEFAVNDNSMAKSSAQLVISSMDYIVRSLVEVNPNVAITFVYTTQSDGQNASEAHHKVAERHGIPEIDLRAPMMAQISQGHAWEEYLKDGAHPNDNGHKFYADQVIAAVLADPERYKAPVTLGKAIGLVKFNDPHIEYVENIADLQLNNFTIQDANDKEKALPELVVKKAAVSESVGATLNYEFEGNNFAIYHRISGNGGAFSVYIDGKLIANVNCYNAGSDSYLARFYRSGLGTGKHTVTITVTDAEPSKKNVAIAGFCVG